MREFEAHARSTGATTETIVAARYALCTLIDETAAGTPWGASGASAQQGLLAMFHGETEGGEKFFQILARLAENPRANLDVIELMYVCLELGFEGRYRVLDGGHRQLDAVRQRVLAIIRQQRGEHERDLSANWHGAQQRSATPGLVVAVGGGRCDGAPARRDLFGLPARLDEYLRCACDPDREPADSRVIAADTANTQTFRGAASGAVPDGRDPTGARRGR